MRFLALTSALVAVGTVLGFAKNFRRRGRQGNAVPDEEVVSDDWSQTTGDSSSKKADASVPPSTSTIAAVPNHPPLFEILGELLKQNPFEIIGHGLVRVVTCPYTGNHFRLKTCPNNGPQTNSLEVAITTQLAPHVHHLLGALCCATNRVSCCIVSILPLGGSLDKYFPAGEEAEVMVCRYVGAQIIAGLRYLHASKIAHQALTLQNLLVDSLGNVLIGDFGDAIQGEKDQRQSNLACPLHSAPECLAEKKGGLPADVWSYGVVMYRMLTGRFPFRDLAKLPADPTNQLFLEMEWHGSMILYQYPVLRDFFGYIFKAKPADRPTVGDVCRHPFFEGIDWDTLAEKAPLLSKVEANKIVPVPLEDLNPRCRAIDGPITRILFAEAEEQ